MVEHPAVRMQVVKLDVRVSLLLQRHVKSVAEHPMVVAALVRQLVAHEGSWATRPARSVELDEAAVVVADCAATRPVKMLSATVYFILAGVVGSGIGYR